MAVIIAGCMRNGTSISSNIMATGGMYVGEHDELDWRGQRDPEGIWENLNFVRLNNRILESRGGHWVKFNRVWQPHYYDWETIVTEKPFSNKLNRKATQYMEFMKERAGGAVWGWKDPRNAMTIPYWHWLTQENDIPIKIVWAIREPRESIDSMHSLGYAGQRDWQGFWNVWHCYNQSMLNFVKAHPEIPCIILRYEDWFNDSENQIRRLFAFAGLNADDIAEVASRIKPELYRYRADERLKSVLYDEIIEMSENQKW